MSAEEPGLLCLPQDVLLGVLSKAGAKAVARAATCCKRLLEAQQALGKLPAFSSAMVLIKNLDHVEEDTAEAVDAALATMPAAVDFALCFVANLPPQGNRSFDPLDTLLQALSARLPPGTKVSGCTGRGIFGVLPCGTPAEIDPSATKSAGVSLLLGRVPGATAHVFAAARPPAGGWGTEAACRAWMGLDGGDSPLAPLSLTLFTKSGCSHLIEGCLGGLHEAFPDMVVTGGIAASGQRRKEVICFEADGGRGTAAAAAAAAVPMPPPAPAAPRADPGRMTTRAAAAAAASPQPSKSHQEGGPSSSQRHAPHQQAERPRGVNAGADQQYVGLVLCTPLDGSSSSNTAEVPTATGGGISSSPTAPAVAAAPAAAPAAGTSALAQQPRRRLCAGAFASRGLLGIKPIFYKVSLARGLGHFVNSEGQQVEMFAVSAAESEGVTRGTTMPHGAALMQLSRIVEELGHADLALWAAESTNIGSYQACMESGQPLVVVETMSHGAAVMGAVDPSLLPALDSILESAERPSHTLAAQLLLTASEGYARDIQRCVPEFTAACPPGGQGHLAALHSSGMVVVSCTAKGVAMHEAEEVEARLLHQAGKIPLAGVYCDGEIGPAARSNEQCGRRWNGGGALAAQCNKVRSALQGFTTIVSVIAGASS